MHVAGVEDDVGALGDPVAINDIIGQGSAHGEVDHRVEAQAFVDEALHHWQLLKVAVLQLSVTCGNQTVTAAALITAPPGTVTTLNLHYLL